MPGSDVVKELHSSVFGMDILLDQFNNSFELIVFQLISC